MSYVSFVLGVREHHEHRMSIDNLLHLGVIGQALFKEKLFFVFKGMKTVRGSDNDVGRGVQLVLLYLALNLNAMKEI